MNDFDHQLKELQELRDNQEKEFLEKQQAEVRVPVN